jgi:hypothetical protein
LEPADALTEPLSQLGQLSGSEDEQSDREKENQVCRLKQTFDHLQNLLEIENLLHNSRKDAKSPSSQANEGFFPYAYSRLHASA